MFTLPKSVGWHQHQLLVVALQPLCDHLLQLRPKLLAHTVNKQDGESGEKGSDEVHIQLLSTVKRMHSGKITQSILCPGG